MTNVRDLLRLSSVPRIGPLKIRALVSHFKDPAEVLNASARDLIKIPGIEKKLASNIVHHKDGEAFADEQLRRANKVGARIVTLWDKEYPDILKKIYDPPPFLFVLGKLSSADRSPIAIVGTRSPSAYGQSVAELFSRELAKLGITIVSGLARGIDTIAHATTLKHGGRTIAVTGSGLDVPYPSENKKLMEKITGHGAVVSEFPMGTKPDAPNFPRRNRIISGLSIATLVVESALDGGAMITATTALDQNREVFAIPGNINERRSNGSNVLIRDGRAKLVITLDDILTELRPQLQLDLPKSDEPPVEIQLTPVEQTIYALLSNNPLHVDAITELANLSTPDTLVTLLSLEFKGLVRQLPGKFFVRA